MSDTDDAAAATWLSLAQAVEPSAGVGGRLCRMWTQDGALLDARDDDRRHPFNASKASDFDRLIGQK